MVRLLLKQTGCIELVSAEVIAQTDRLYRACQQWACQCSVAHDELVTHKAGLDCQGELCAKPPISLWIGMHVGACVLTPHVTQDCEAGGLGQRGGEGGEGLEMPRLQRCALASLKDAVLCHTLRANLSPAVMPND